jgi:carbonic anhydrase
MSVIDDALRANQTFAQTFNSELGRAPAPRLAIVTCMDPRLTDLGHILGLRIGDADIIRNAGSAITADSLRSLLVSTRVLGTREIMIINHTDCGMMTFRDEELESKLEQLTGSATIVPERFHSFTDAEANTWEQVRKVRAHPWIPKDVRVRGFIYDVNTGRMREVTGAAASRAA